MSGPIVEVAVITYKDIGQPDAAKIEMHNRTTAKTLTVSLGQPFESALYRARQLALLLGAKLTVDGEPDTFPVIEPGQFSCFVQDTATHNGW